MCLSSEGCILDTTKLNDDFELTMIIVVDFGMGNLRSISRKMAKLDIPNEISADPQKILGADKIILPGVGAFGAGMNNLRTLCLIDVLNQKVLVEKIPILGVCLGLQLFCRRSEEGNVAGLGWIDAEAVRFKFPAGSDLRVPHVGWNTLTMRQNSCLLINFEPERRFYFTHSFYIKCYNHEDVVASTHYGGEFASVIRHDNIFGVQFHPEKSHKKGTEVYRNFVEAC